MHLTRAQRWYARGLGLVLLSMLLLGAGLYEAEHHCGDATCTDDHGGYWR